MLLTNKAPVTDWEVEEPELGFYVAVDRLGNVRRIATPVTHDDFTRLWGFEAHGYWQITPDILLWTQTASHDPVNVPVSAILRALAKRDSSSAKVLTRTVYGTVLFTGKYDHAISTAPTSLSLADEARLAVFFKLASEELTKDYIMTT